MARHSKKLTGPADNTANGGSPSDRYNNSLMGALSGSSWTKFHRAFLFNMTDGEAVVLAYLIDTYNVLYEKGYLRRSNGWFYCKMEKMQQELNKAPRAQRHCLSGLVKRGFVKTKLCGWPAKRFIRVNDQAVAAAIEEYMENIKEWKDDHGYL